MRERVCVGVCMRVGLSVGLRLHVCAYGCVCMYVAQVFKRDLRVLCVCVRVSVCYVSFCEAVSRCVLYISE